MKTIRLTQTQYNRLNGIKGWLMVITVLMIGGLILTVIGYITSILLYGSWFTSNLASISVLFVPVTFLIKRFRFFPLAFILSIMYGCVIYLISLAQNLNLSSSNLLAAGLSVLIIPALMIVYMLFSARVAVTFKTKKVEIIPEPVWDDIPAIVHVTADVLQTTATQNLPENPQIPAGASLEDVYGHEYWMDVPTEEMQKEEEDQMDQDDPEYRQKRARLIALIGTIIATVILLVAARYFPPT